MTRPVQLPLELGCPPALGGADFLPAPGNADALDWIRHWPDWPGPVLVVTGPPGCGKTHLARIWAERADAAWHAGDELGAERDPLELLGGHVACVVDGIEAVRSERALLHLHNLVAERAGHLLLTRRGPEQAWRPHLPDLDSRLRAAAHVAIDPPDDELLAAVLVKQFADRQLRVDAGVVNYLTTRMERSFAAARDIVARLDAASLSAARPITLAMARELLREPEEPCKPERPTMASD